MNINEQIYHGVVDKSVLVNWLGDYRNFNDKVSRLIAKKQLIHVKKGLYITQQSVERGELSEFQVANFMYGPSYVSFFTALSYHGIIPERVNVIESAVLKRSKEVEIDLGRFTYQKMNEATFYLGVDHTLQGPIGILVASPTKAILDILWKEKVSFIYGVKGLGEYLQLDLRIDESYIRELDLDTIERAIAVGKRKRVIKLLKNLIVKIRTA